MQVNPIEYRVSGSPLSGWKIFRQDAQIGVRYDLFEAVGLATHFAEREVILGQAIAKVVLDGTLMVGGDVRSDRYRIQ